MEVYNYCRLKLNSLKIVYKCVKIYCLLHYKCGVLINSQLLKMKVLQVLGNSLLAVTKL